MLIAFSLIFTDDTEVIFFYNFVLPLISLIKVWNTLPAWLFQNSLNNLKKLRLTAIKT